VQAPAYRPASAANQLAVPRPAVNFRIPAASSPTHQGPGPAQTVATQATPATHGGSMADPAVPQLTTGPGESTLAVPKPGGIIPGLAGGGGAGGAGAAGMPNLYNYMASYPTVAAALAAYNRDYALATATEQGSLTQLAESFGDPAAFQGDYNARASLAAMLGQDVGPQAARVALGNTIVRGPGGAISYGHSTAAQLQLAANMALAKAAASGMAGGVGGMTSAVGHYMNLANIENSQRLFNAIAQLQGRVGTLNTNFLKTTNQGISGVQSAVLKAIPGVGKNAASLPILGLNPSQQQVANWVYQALLGRRTGTAAATPPVTRSSAAAASAASGPVAQRIPRGRGMVGAIPRVSQVGAQAGARTRLAPSGRALRARVGI
jgi:hypothetical protein